jgi:menaquinone-9 beta-reductase
MKKDYDIIIVGGGLAGLTAAILLSRKKRVLLIEKRQYPFHKVCGEYVSNEVFPFLKSIGFNPFDYRASTISKLRISTSNGRNIHTKLDLGGFGLSRYVMDNAIAEIAKNCGAEMLTGVKCNDIVFSDNLFHVKTNGNHTITCDFVIGSYGKRDTLDKKLNRNFINAHTGYLGVKYHIKTDYPIDEIGLDNFENGYCGIVKIESDKYNLCYLYRRSRFVEFEKIKELEEEVLYKNPILRNIFTNSEFLFNQPEVINEISFAPKEAVKEHIFMCGDSAGLITPLCGNGMSMAIHAAKILSDILLESTEGYQVQISASTRQVIENRYLKEWKNNFSRRLFWGRTTQSLFNSPTFSSIGIRTIHALPPVEKWFITNTHGKPISEAVS